MTLRVALLHLTLPLLFVCSCAGSNKDAERPNGPVDCEKACENLKGASCREGDPTPVQNKPCETWCVDYHWPRGKPGYLPPWAGCVGAAGSDPDKINLCPMSCTRKE